MTLPSPHVSGVSDDQRYLHRGDVEEDRYIQGPGTPHIAGHKDIDPGQARQCQATIRLVPNVCVLRICGCLPVVCPPLTPGSTYAPPLLSTAVIIAYYRDHHSITVSNKSLLHTWSGESSLSAAENCNLIGANCQKVI